MAIPIDAAQISAQIFDSLVHLPQIENTHQCPLERQSSPIQIAGEGMGEEGNHSSVSDQQDICQVIQSFLDAAEPSSSTPTLSATSSPTVQLPPHHAGSIDPVLESLSYQAPQPSLNSPQPMFRLDASTSQTIIGSSERDPVSQRVSPAPLPTPSTASISLSQLASPPRGQQPNYPWWTIIRAAIMGSPNGILTREEICEAIAHRWEYFRSTSPADTRTWKSAVGHNLSVKECFVRVFVTGQGSMSYYIVDTAVDPAKGRPPKHKIGAAATSSSSSERLAVPRISRNLSLPSNLDSSYQPRWSPAIAALRNARQKSLNIPQDCFPHRPIATLSKPASETTQTLSINNVRPTTCASPAPQQQFSSRPPSSHCGTPHHSFHHDLPRPVIPGLAFSRSLSSALINTGESQVCLRRRAPASAAARRAAVAASSKRRCEVAPLTSFPSNSNPLLFSGMGNMVPTLYPPPTPRPAEPNLIVTLDNHSPPASPAPVPSSLSSVVQHPASSDVQPPSCTQPVPSLPVSPSPQPPSNSSLSLEEQVMSALTHVKSSFPSVPSAAPSLSPLSSLPSPLPGLSVVSSSGCSGSEGLLGLDAKVASALESVKASIPFLVESGSEHEEDEELEGHDESLNHHSHCSAGATDAAGSEAGVAGEGSPGGPLFDLERLVREVRDEMFEQRDSTSPSGTLSGSGSLGEVGGHKVKDCGVGKQVELVIKGGAQVSQEDEEDNEEEVSRLMDSLLEGQVASPLCQEEEEKTGRHTAKGESGAETEASQERVGQREKVVESNSVHDGRGKTPDDFLQGLIDEATCELRIQDAASASASAPTEAAAATNFGSQMTSEEVLSEAFLPEILKTGVQTKKSGRVEVEVFNSRDIPVPVSPLVGSLESVHSSTTRAVDGAVSAAARRDGHDGGRIEGDEWYSSAAARVTQPVPPLSALPAHSPRDDPDHPAPSTSISNSTFLDSIKVATYDRPQATFPELAKETILSHPDGKLTACEMFEVLERRYPFFLRAPESWKATLRNVLTSHSCFVKVPRPSDVPGKRGDWWATVDLPLWKRRRTTARAKANENFLGRHVREEQERQSRELDGKGDLGGLGDRLAGHKRKGGRGAGGGPNKMSV